MTNYPRMLYRPGSGPDVVWNELVDTRIVENSQEEMQAIREGWLQDPSKACLKSKIKRIRLRRWHRFAQHWQFWITSLIALAAVVVGYLALK